MPRRRQACRESPVWITALGVLGVLAVLALGLWLRLDGIAASLWIDEFGTFWVVEGDVATMLSRAWRFQGQSPLYYLLPWLSVHTFGESEVALRAPSLVLGVAFSGAMYVCGRLLAGPRAAFWSAALSWLAGPAIRASVEARPYVLVFLCAAIAVTGFVWTVRSGGRSARLLWILGGAGVAWSHYVHYPLVLGLFAAYVAMPALRRRYGVRSFLVDAALQGGLVVLCAPQVLSLLMRQGTLSWLDEWNYFAFLGPLLPLFPAIAIGALTGDRRPEAPLEIALHRCLIICLLCQVCALEVAAFAGTNLLTARYFLSTLVPAVLLAAAALARSQTLETGSRRPGVRGDHGAGPRRDQAVGRLVLREWRRGLAGRGDGSLGAPARRTAPTRPLSFRFRRRRCRAPRDSGAGDAGAAPESRPAAVRRAGHVAHVQMEPAAAAGVPHAGPRPSHQLFVPLLPARTAMDAGRCELFRSVRPLGRRHLAGAIRGRAPDVRWRGTGGVPAVPVRMTLAHP